jgi:hypothetical protein
MHGLAYIAERVAPDGDTEALLNERQHVEQLLESRNTIEAMAIGNSHNWSLNLQTLGYRGYRFTRPAADLFEIHYQLETLLPRTTSVKTIFIPISYHMFRFNTVNAEDTAVRRIHMYTATPSWKFMKGDFRNFMAGKINIIVPIQSVVRKDNWKDIFDELTGSGEEERFPFDIPADDCDYLEIERLIDYTEKRVARTIRLTRDMLAKQPTLEEDSFEVITKIILFLHARQIRVIFFTPPYFHTYTDLYLAQDGETVARMQQTMRRLQQEYGVEYYDFSRSKEFITQNTLFRDGDHLHGCGAILFSEKFKQVLQETDRLIYLKNETLRKKG